MTLYFVFLFARVDRKWALTLYLVFLFARVDSKWVLVGYILTSFNQFLQPFVYHQKFWTFLISVKGRFPILSKYFFQYLSEIFGNKFMISLTEKRSRNYTKMYQQNVKLKC